ncbi:hypothetical protein [Pedobacter frigidisoli]|uniref:hypothetical protein n=1 Tax=Pedobacter frigidisoli TaxID=2530455 RepID=UPI00292F66F6|nr:hypothetical protein [Pedobacter frigidisoli]
MKKQLKKGKSEPETNQLRLQNDAEASEKAEAGNDHRNSTKKIYWSLVDCELGKKKISLSLNDVLRFATHSPYSIVYLKNGENKNIRTTKSELRTCLDPGRFAETSGGCFYSLDMIAGIEGTKQNGKIILKPGNRDDQPLKISRRFFNSFYKAFSLYVVNNQLNVEKNF